MNRLSAHSEPINEKLPFAEAKASKAFMSEAQLLLVREMMRRSGEFIPEESNQMFYHGRDWTYQREEREGYTLQVGHLELHQQTVTIDLERLLANDMGLLPEFILGFGEESAVKLAKKLDAVRAAVAEEAGNTISVPQDHSMIEAYLEMLDRGLWSIDRNGNLCAPRILPDAKSQLRFVQEMSERGEEFQNRLKVLIARKEPVARQAEADRLKKFDILA